MTESQPISPAPGPGVECTVIVPSYSGVHRLPDLLDAFERQDFAGDWELLVVIDGRLDDTEQLLAEHADRLPLRWIVHEISQGISKAMNVGLREAQGRIVIRCDDDLTPQSDFISRHLSHHHGAASGIIGPTRDVFPNSRYASAYGRPANQRALRATYARESDQNWIAWAANNSAPRLDLLAVGGFDETLFYGEDSELGFRLHQRGLTILVDPQLETLHRGPAQNAEARIPRAFISGASAKAFSDRHPGVLRVDQHHGGSLLQRFWRTAVAALASMLTNRQRCRTLGRGVDRSIRFLPDAVSGKLLAFCVEAAGMAGRRFGRGDTTHFHAQKSSDVAAEKRLT
ncbi:glycosyltransferase family 2 protein [Pseudoclavibacter helvolus]|uniref:glycosyltransferase family 2 protein n=1 Tax=Pseudoclavibacter helvolus TaxID=255205 RepID=UPI003C711255